MHPVQVLERLGGVGDAAHITAHTSRKRLRGAVERGEVLRDERGRYSLPGADGARAAANRLSGVLGGLSAAQAHGWALKRQPERPTVIVPRHRTVAASRRRGVEVRYLDLGSSAASRGVTTAVATVMDCARWLPFDEALTVADSALRERDVTREGLLAAAQDMPRQHRGRCLRVAEAADGRSANPFESVLRAIALGVPGLHVVPQVVIDGIGRPDLVDERLGLVVEADSFEFHGHRRALADDCRRYNAFALAGWLVLRFTWEDVMLHPESVRRALLDAVALRATRAGRSRPRAAQARWTA